MKLSILIPTYNDDCLELVKTLQVQAINCMKDDFEIIVADDGSTDESVKERNRKISELHNCRVIFRKTNVGRACIRNFLVRESCGEYIIFIDGDLCIIKDDFIKQYVAVCKENQVVYGGYELKGNKKQLNGNLRFKYEMKCRGNHTAEKRTAKPYKDFHTSNFLAPRNVLQSIPFDENFKEYGYEDVFFGKQLKEKKVDIVHIKNPVSFYKFEENADFLNKIDQAIRTLVKFKEELKDYNSLLKMAIRINELRLTFLFRFLYKTFNKPIKNNLLGNKPSIFLFNLYKILKINEIY